MTDVITRELDRILEDLLLQEINAPRNAVVSIEVPGTGFRYEKAVGVARPDTGEPMTPSHSFHWASIAKMATATLILQLWEEGCFGDEGLDRPLRELAILPDVIINHLNFSGDTNQGGNITLRHLLTHTSGMRDAMQDGPEQTGAGAGGLAPGSLLAHWFFDKTTHHAPHPMQPWNAEADPTERFAGVINFYCFKDLYAKAALSKPGKAFHYSDTGFVLLGLVIEKITGKPFHQNLLDRIFTPLSLSDIYMAYRSDPDLGICRQPESEIYFGDMPCLSAGLDLSFDWGGGGVVSTARTLSFFFKSLMAGKLFKYHTTLQQMLIWQCPSDLSLPRTGVGLGIFRMDYPGGELWGHSGAWGAKMFWDPDSDIYVAGTVNQAMGNNNWHWPFFEFIKKSGVNKDE